LFGLSIGLALGAFFLIGAFKGHILGASIVKHGVQTLAVGGAAAALAYSVGLLLRNLFNIV
jgi:VIT1/CCC1 family predicted Fe2+/Mn2+ transporter